MRLSKNCNHILSLEGFQMQAKEQADVSGKEMQLYQAFLSELIDEHSFIQPAAAVVPF